MDISEREKQGWQKLWTNLDENKDENILTRSFFKQNTGDFQTFQGFTSINEDAEGNSNIKKENED